MTPDPLTESIRQNLEAVRSRILRAASSVGRSPSDIRLVAVSKTFPASHVRAAALAGQRDFGENKIQEALAKIEATADLGLAWHLIGHLQSNKARRSVGPFGMIHSVDSLSLLERLDAAASEARTNVEVLAQVDLAGETTKFGLNEDAVPAVFQAAHRFAGVQLVGLMLLPPFAEDPEAARPYFRRLMGMKERLISSGVPARHLRELSMGMSHDFEVAIQEGATIVRVGTAIFGARVPARAALDSLVEPGSISA